MIAIIRNLHNEHRIYHTHSGIIYIGYVNRKAVVMSYHGGKIAPDAWLKWLESVADAESKYPARNFFKFDNLPDGGSAFDLPKGNER